MTLRLLLWCLAVAGLSSCHLGASQAPEPTTEPVPGLEAPRAVRVALEELEYHDAGFREAAAARLIEQGPDARPFVREVLLRAKDSGKDVLAAQCDRILEGIEVYRSFRAFVTNELTPRDELRVYPDPPRVRFDLSPELFVEGTLLFGIQGRLRPLGPIGPPPSIVRVFAVQGRDGPPLELKGWKLLAGMLKPAVGAQAIHDITILVIKMCASEACSCIDPADVRVGDVSFYSTPSEVGGVANAVARDPTDTAGSSHPFQITFDSDGRVREVRYSIERHRHL